MAGPTQSFAAPVVALWRYPVKSMLGEDLNASEVTENGLLGDRAYGLVDSSDGKVVSAKNPRKWPGLFDFRAALSDFPTTGKAIPPVHIALPDGAMVSSSQPDIHRILSAVLKRPVTLEAAGRGRLAGTEAMTRTDQRAGTAEEYWPDMEGLDHRDTVTDFALPEGTFFDAAVVHVLTTATLDRLRELCPQARFEARRFRPNIMIKAANGGAGFVENAWIGRTLAIGGTVRLSITGACPRCVMTTLAQGDLPQDVKVLRTAAQHNQVNVGVYASVLRGGTVRRGDAVILE
jgi:uncharacterized protein